tara:strand:- start:121 stop:363 length:243 start_codon:yes stop_codon:yes gene_type:complete
MSSAYSALSFAALLVYAAISSLFAQVSFAQLSLEVSLLQQAPTIDGEIFGDEWSGAVIIDQPFLQFEPDFGLGVLNLTNI